MLRELRIDDAFEMNKWMQDESITACFDRDFSKYSVEDCKKFIEDNTDNYNLSKPNYLHFAVTDNSNEYIGTVSLKHINYDIKYAEFAIVLISKAQGTGLARIAFNEIMQYGFEKLGLSFIYFSCKKDNVVANKFYNKMNAILVKYEELLKILHGKIMGYDDNIASTMLWYVVEK